MNLNSIDSLIEIVNRNLIESQNRPLNSPETMILQGVWQYRTYTQIALEGDYSPRYFTNVVAPELYKRLSCLIGQRVAKKNCRTLIESFATDQITSETPCIREKSADVPANTQSKRNTFPDYLSGSVPIDSPYYIKRLPVEAQVYEEIQKPGALVRITA